MHTDRRMFLRRPTQVSSNVKRTSAALDHVSQIVAACRKSCEQLARSTQVGTIRTVGIVGAGVMGAAIAQEHAERGYSVVLCDTDPEALRKAASGCGTGFSRNERRWTTGFSRNEAANPSETEGRLGPIHYTLSLADLASCDLVLESIVEKRPAKQALYHQLAPLLAKGARLATNTSTIPISRLAAGLAGPDRFCGMHFCHPVRLRPLVEIVPGSATAAETIATVAAHAASLGKIPLLVQDAAGFVVNRLLLAYLNSALDRLIEGVPPHAIDAAMRDFGMPMGPLEQLDEIGLDTALASGIVLSEVTERRSRGTEVLLSLVKARQLGLKTGAGIYCYPGKAVNQSLEGFVAACGRCNRSGLSDPPKPIALQMLEPMVAEAGRLIAEKKAVPSQIDLATVFGLGFPSWRGGLLWWAEGQGFA